MPRDFKRVPAVDKCFAILQLLSESDSSLGISDISNRLSFSKSTVYNLVYTLKDLEIVEQTQAGKFEFGLQLYRLGNRSGRKSELVQTVHPYLEKINRETRLSAFLGIRSGLEAVIIDKVDSAFDIKISSEIGMRLPLTAGAGGKALLSLMSDEEIDRLLNDSNIKKFTPRTGTDKARFRKSVINVRADGYAYDDEEYIDGIVALAVPIKTRRAELQAALWAVGLKKLVLEDRLSSARKLMLDTANKLSTRLSLTDVSADNVPS